MHYINWYKPGRIITVNDKMQKNYSYILTSNYGKDFDINFKPELSPEEMLILGVFEGKYLNDCINEFPYNWYIKAKRNNKISLEKPDININLFKIKSRLSLKEWIKRNWIPITKGDNDIRGWFQWYCRYYIGRRDPNVDSIQIKRWKAFIRHKGQIIKSLERMKKNNNKIPKTKKELLNHRPRQRQALLQWAYNPYITI